MLKTLLTHLCVLLGYCALAQNPINGQLFEIQSSETGFTPSIKQFEARPTGSSKIQLSWTVSDSLLEFITVERAANGKPFETVAVLRTMAGKTNMDWQDDAPLPGRNNYRLRCSLRGGQQILGAMTTTVIAERNSFRFYPNPVDQVLIIRSEYPVDLTILDAQGKARITVSNTSGLQLLNVAALEKGAYLIRVFNRSQNTSQLERLIKN
ncbi:MAG: hypothetical protein RL732_1088 [Bacteroidota bacterium]|jgi:hypothetical protein